MKKVRFESPENVILTRMNDSECHSPRPFIERKVCANVPEISSLPRVVPFSNDPVQRFECTNSSPYPIASKTTLPGLLQHDVHKPSNELELSMLDSWNPGPRQSYYKAAFNTLDTTPLCNTQTNVSEAKSPQLLTSIENRNLPRNILTKDNDFFIKRENIHKFRFGSHPIQEQFNQLTLGKENNPSAIKIDLRKSYISSNPSEAFEKHTMPGQVPVNNPNSANEDCRCHHCTRVIQNAHYIAPCTQRNRQEPTINHCLCSLAQPINKSYCNCHSPPVKQSCTCNKANCDTSKQNAVNKKTWAIEKYEQSKKSEQNMEVEKQTNVVKEKREPTVADLFKIIKLQNEQLQLLQEKVDKFISASQQGAQKELPEGIFQQSNEERKISIGVMTSFEMVTTSTVINKEIVMQAKDNSQIQCNRSQISMKEVVTKSQPANLNFLDGIAPVSKNVQAEQNVMGNQINDEKTLNEYSLYNVQVDNATTPMISPEHSLYLDVRDYSDSDASCDDQSNVGWTYYNKVMTHVNGMLQDSDMPSSASALYRNTRQQCVQMQIDKTNVSVTKRVKFGDDPLGIRQPHIYVALTDTSLKMNQLAAKYLKQAQPQSTQRQAPKQVMAPNDISFATRNYMEKHRLIQEGPFPRDSPALADLPKFLDITALKQQPKLL